MVRVNSIHIRINITHPNHEHVYFPKKQRWKQLRKHSYRWISSWSRIPWIKQQLAWYYQMLECNTTVRSSPYKGIGEMKLYAMPRSSVTLLNNVITSSLTSKQYSTYITLIKLVRNQLLNSMLQRMGCSCYLNAMSNSNKLNLIN